MATGSIQEGMESVGLADDKGAQIGVQAGNLDQASFFRAVQEGHLSSLNSLLKNRKNNIDINAYNSEGATALHLAVYKYEEGRSVEIVNSLLEHGADITIKAAPPPSAHKISITRHDHSGGVQETKKITFDNKTPLLIALELKSSLYLKGWEYRHWDQLICILASATLQFYGAKNLKVPAYHPGHISDVVQHNWEAVFNSGKHDVVELVAEGKDIQALRLLVTGASKILKLNLVETARVEIHDASYNLAKAMVHFLYVGKLNPEFVSHRGIDLFITAHKYGVHCLEKMLEAAIDPTPEIWIKLLTAAVESDSSLLALKTAHSIKDVLEGRHAGHGTLKKSFSNFEEAPQQLFTTTSPTTS